MLKVQGLDAWYDRSHVVQGLDFEVRTGADAAALAAPATGAFTKMLASGLASPKANGPASPKANGLAGPKN